MRVKISTTSRLVRSGDSPTVLGDAAPPEIVEGDASRLANIENRKSVHAKACIYCGSQEKLSDEHVIPYAWGGNLQIFNGSCRMCQDETQLFENFALNDGAMASVRMIRGIQSRSDHKSVRETIPITLTKTDGREVIEEVATSSVPLILGFPWFSLPGVLEGSGRSSLEHVGWLPASYGEDIEKFLLEHDAKTMHTGENRKQPVAFARTIAKIAYCYAWLDGVFEHIHGSDELVDAFMRRPERLGLYVGMKPQPFERFPGLGFRLQYRLEQSNPIYMEVQPFPDTPAPTYLVALGACSNLRKLRKTRLLVSAGLVPEKLATR